MKLAMRIWSLHPKYLDDAGLIKLWQEGLKAIHILENEDPSIYHHFQLSRFIQTQNPIRLINDYLKAVYDEGRARNLSFDKNRLLWDSHRKYKAMKVTIGQITYESLSLLDHLDSRDPERHKKYRKNYDFDAHPMFRVVNGEIESWEVIE